MINDILNYYGKEGIVKRNFPQNIVILYPKQTIQYQTQLYKFWWLDFLGLATKIEEIDGGVLYSTPIFHNIGKISKPRLQKTYDHLPFFDENDPRKMPVDFAVEYGFHKKIMFDFIPENFCTYNGQ